MFFFSKNDVEFEPKSLEHAYLAILNDDLQSALEVFKINHSPRAKWGIVLCEILKGHIVSTPSYFQIRNFLEIDLDFLLKNEKIDYVEMVLGSVDYLAEINQEAYKFTARVMFENKLYNVAQKYMEKSKKYLYSDPELHFMLARLYITLHNFEQAEYYLGECLKILPNYYPAKVLRNEVLEKLNLN